MNDRLSFHHIGKPVALSEIKDNPDTRYSTLYDMYTLDNLNELSLPIQLHAFGERSPLDERIQQLRHSHGQRNMERAAECPGIHYAAYPHRYGRRR